MGKHANFHKMISLSLPAWRRLEAHGVSQIKVERGRENSLTALDGHRFINMASCSYLGLDTDPRLTEGAIAALQRDGSLTRGLSRSRISPALLGEAEEELSDLFECEAIVSSSCTAATASALPVLASGHLTGGQKPLIVFDKHCHFSMALMKNVCADETEVLACDHNDTQQLEDLCKKRKCVAFVTDGAYSLGDATPVRELVRLQDKYGVFLYFDDSHSLSVIGSRGAGFVKSTLGTLGERTIIVASLAKAFGACGGVTMLPSKKHRSFIEYGGGPIGWSQAMNAAGLGAILASAGIHRTSELAARQERLASHMRRIDDSVPTPNSGNGLPIRFVALDTGRDPMAIARQLFDDGYYVSAVFFPVVQRDRQGIRFMGRATLTDHELNRFLNALHDAADDGAAHDG